MRKYHGVKMAVFSNPKNTAWAFFFSLLSFLLSFFFLLYDYIRTCSWSDKTSLLDNLACFLTVYVGELRFWEDQWLILSHWWSVNTRMETFGSRPSCEPGGFHCNTHSDLTCFWGPHPWCQKDSAVSSQGAIGLSLLLGFSPPSGPGISRYKGGYMGKSGGRRRGQRRNQPCLFQLLYLTVALNLLCGHLLCDYTEGWGKENDNHKRILDMWPWPFHF